MLAGSACPHCIYQKAQNSGCGILPKKQQSAQICLSATGQQETYKFNWIRSARSRGSGLCLRSFLPSLFFTPSDLSKNIQLHLVHLRRCFLPLLPLRQAALVLSTMLVYKKLCPTASPANILWKTRLKLLKHLFLWKVFNTLSRNLSFSVETKRQQQNCGRLFPLDSARSQ